ncbi:MAG: PBP1A family penicillin-binding protein [Deltaproteobacteria bacterium]|nr:PBP1A family penicillin-binding protein [Deltaproteobacteria bacterium]
MPNNNNKKKKNIKKKRVKKKPFSFSLIIFFIKFFVILGFFGIFVVSAFLYFYIIKDLPKISSLADYKPPVITTIYSDDNKTIGEFYKEKRIVIPLSDMPQRLKEAFIAAEDSRFYSHEGIDFISVVRAFLKNIKAGTIVQGGSTITQQVTKSFFLTPERSYIRKINEAFLAYRIDRKFTKAQILYLYLNQIYLGHGAYGVEAAANNYFGKSVKELNLAECSMLAGLPQAPSRYSPFRDIKKAQARQSYVLDRMVAEKYITDKEAAEAANTKLDIKPRRSLYMDEVPYYTEHIRRYIVGKYGKNALYNEGLKIYTSVNIKLQKEALNAVKTGLFDLDKRRGYPKQPESIEREQYPEAQAALLCMEAETGRVKAMIGGFDFKKSQFNRAIQALRQPGSAFKPIIYSAALDKGYTPATVLIDSPVVFVNPWQDKVWKPKNYKEEFYGHTLLRKALAKSRNVVTVKILKDIGIDYAIDYAKKMKIKSELTKNLSLALGTSDVTLFELVTAYSIFANKGFYIEPVFVTEIIDRNGNVLERHSEIKEKIIEENTAYIVTSLLESVVREGTGRRAKALKRPVACKTGTTNNFYDAWFVGYSPEYITGVWVGFDERKSLGKHETGAKAASPIWIDFMQKALENKPVTAFQIPEGVIFTKIDAKTGLLAGPDSEKTIIECFKEGTEPVEQTPSEGAVTETDLFKY